MGVFQPNLRPEFAPHVEQLEEYRDLMVDTARSVGKGVRVLARYPGAEFMIPGGMTEWSEPDRKGHIHIEHDRQYSASFREIGDAAFRLMVIENESWLLPGKEKYLTYRNMYRFSWNGDAQVVDSQVLGIEIISSAKVEGVFDPGADKLPVMLQVSRTDDGQEPFRMMEHLMVDEVAFDCLLERTDSYQRDLLDQLDGRESETRIAS